MHAPSHIFHAKKYVHRTSVTLTTTYATAAGQGSETNQSLSACGAQKAKKKEVNADKARRSRERLAEARRRLKAEERSA